jgi:hypothetical protein
MLRDFKISLEPNFIQNQRLKHNFSKRQGCWCKVLGFFLEFGFIFVRKMAWTNCRDCRLWLVFDSWWTCGGKNSPELERAVVVMHGSLPWMLGEKKGLFRDLTGRSLGRWSDGCGLAMRSGSNGDLSFGESELLRKRTPKEDREWMRRRIMRLPTPFIGRMREGRQYRGGETVDGDCSYSMLPFRGKEMKGQRPFRKGKEACDATLGSRAEGQLNDATARRCAVAADSRSWAAPWFNRGGR